MTDSKHQSVWNWIYENDEISDLFFNFSTSESGDVVIATDATDFIETRYVDGTTKRHYDFSIVSYQDLNTDAPNDTLNIKIIESVESLMEWVRTQNKLRNFPVFPDNCSVLKVEVLQDIPTVAGQDETTAKYLFGCRITYIQKGENL